MGRKKKGQVVSVRGSESEFGSELESWIERAGREAAGRPLGEVLRAESNSLLSRLIGRIVQIALDEEMAAHLGYDHYERRDERDTPQLPPNYRNGSYSRHLQTSHGPTPVRMPRDREASFEPTIIPSHTSITQDIEERVVSMYTAGMTTRDIEDHLRQIYHIEANPMMISRLTARLDDELRQWRNRPLEAVYPILFIDAMRVSIRQPTGVAPTALYNVCGRGCFGAPCPALQSTPGCPYTWRAVLWSTFALRVAAPEPLWTSIAPGRRAPPCALEARQRPERSGALEASGAAEAPNH